MSAKFGSENKRRRNVSRQRERTVGSRVAIFARMKTVFLMGGSGEKLRSLGFMRAEKSACLDFRFVLHISLEREKYRGMRGSRLT